MPEPIDISQLGKNKTADGPTTFDSLTPEQQAAAEALAERSGETGPPEVNPNAIPVNIAFLVIVFPDGNVEVSPDVARGADLELDHFPVVDEVYGALAAAMDDLSTTKTAQKVQHAIAALGQIAQQRAQEAQIMQQMQQNGPGGPFQRP